MSSLLLLVVSSPQGTAVRSAVEWARPQVESAGHWFESDAWRVSRARLLFETRRSWREGSLNSCFGMLSSAESLAESLAGRNDAHRALGLRGLDSAFTPAPALSDRHDQFTVDLTTPGFLDSPALRQSERAWLPLAIGVKAHGERSAGHPMDPLPVLTLRRFAKEVRGVDELVAVAWGLALARDSDSADVIRSWIRDPLHEPILEELMAAITTLDYGPPEDLLMERLKDAHWNQWRRFAPVILTGTGDSPTLRRLCELAAQELAPDRPDATRHDALDILGQASTDQSARLLLAALESAELGSPFEKAVAAALIRTHSRPVFQEPPLEPTRWLGKSLDVALRELGPPSHVHMLGKELTKWHWAAPGSARHSAHGVLSVQAGRIVHIHQPSIFQRGSLPADGAYIGQPVEQLLERLGSPDAVRTNAVPAYQVNPTPAPPGDTVLTYGDVWMTLNGSRVIGIGPPIRSMSSGPR